MQFQRHSGVYTLTTTQVLSADKSVVWNFFSNPANLNRLTPPEVGFEITSEVPSSMYPGQLITYRIQLFPFYKTNWVTEITQVAENRFFIDEQRFGPYRMWHHEHVFEEISEGVLMTDRITFKLPYGILGRLAYRIFVKQKLTAIFSYRAKAVRALFQTA